MSFSFVTRRSAWQSLLLLFAMSALPTPAILADTPLLDDDFNDNSIDPAKWSVVTAGVPQTPISVVETGGMLELEGRGHLNTFSTFNPSSQPEQGLRITGQWTFVGSDDMLQILTRSDGTPSGSFGETANGVEFRAQGSGISGTMTIGGRGGATVTGISNNGPLNPSAGETYNFEIRDTGTNLYFSMDQVGGSKKQTVVATSLSNLSSNLVTFHNRESGRRSNLDNVVIDSPSFLGPTDPAFNIVLQDNFDDNSLDGSKWNVVTAGIPGSPSVTEANSRLQLVERGHLVSAQQFDPADGALRVEGRWTFGSDDFMQVLTRSDGTPGGGFGETLNGIQFFAFDANDTMTISERVAGGATSLGSFGIDIDAGDVFDFLIIDDGDNLLFELSEVGGDGTFGSLTANSTQVYADNYLVFHNRENNGRTAFLDDVVVSQFTTVPEPASLILWSLIGVGLIGLGLYRRRVMK